jgi:hypothetical protein
MTTARIFTIPETWLCLEQFRYDTFSNLRYLSQK